MTKQEIDDLIAAERAKVPVGGCTCPKNPHTGMRIAFDNACAVHVENGRPKP